MDFPMIPSPSATQPPDATAFVRRQYTHHIRELNASDLYSDCRQDLVGCGISDLGQLFVTDHVSR